MTTDAPLLDGVRVVETASMVAGAATGMLLGDLGADVVKVEHPHGDPLRHSLGQIVPGFSPAHLQLNRNKRSVTADLRAEAGRELLTALIESADVLIDGNAVGTLSRWGFDAHQLRTVAPGLVVCSVSGYGSVGPYGSLPTHGLMMSALVGAVSDAPDARPASGRGDGPLAAANSAALHIVSALYRRATTGVGASIDVSGADALLLQTLLVSAYELNRDRIADASSIPLPENGFFGPRYRLYDARDGRRIAFTALEEKFWRAFCDAVARPDLLDASHDDTLAGELGRIFATRDADEWVDTALAHRLPLGPAYQALGEVADDRHLGARAILRPTDHPIAGRFVCVGTPAVVAGQDFSVRRHAPSLGEHNADVCAELHIDG